MPLSATSRTRLYSRIWFVLKGLLSGVLGAFIGLLVWYAIWAHWNATVYQPWLANELAQGRDDGGSSEGWVFLLGLTPSFKWGFVVGVACFLILCAWKRKRRATQEPR